MESAEGFLEEKKLLTEAKYRNYMSNIDKALRNFEFSSEWADLISALGKLSKAISSNAQYQVIPRRIKISKRLAQCMHPALPSGVHLKALETYGVIFSKTGPERLATELFIYSAGLFPLLGYAAMNVRPALLGIYETHFVPLGEKLRPALSGFLSGVLPGYECGLDHFERTNSLLCLICNAVNSAYFYTVLWECIATNASIRLPAITYVLDHFTKRLDMQEQVHVVGHSREVMMSGLCACLNDSMILVQRNTLEFLLLGFPMHTSLLQQDDLVKLVTNAVNTILRRDMSLNRRLYSWLLGSEIAKKSSAFDTLSIDGQPDDRETYFEKYSREVLIQSLINTLKISLECTPVDLKPYRIMVSLLDKADIGSAVLDYVLCDIIRSMYLSRNNPEVNKSANLLFVTFDPAYIWSYITSMYESSCKLSAADEAKPRGHRNNENHLLPVVGSGHPCLEEICMLTEYLLETISLEMYNETTRLYLPKVFLSIIQLLTFHIETVTADEVTASLKLCMRIVSRVQPTMTSPTKLTPYKYQYCSSSDEKGGSTKSSLKLSTATSGSLEKSKSDSRLNNISESPQGANPSIEEPIPRSSSSQSVERKSPKKKKSKSYSKLSELEAAEVCDVDIAQQSSSDLDTPLSIKKLKSKAKAHLIRASPKRLRSKHIAPNEVKLPERASEATEEIADHETNNSHCDEAFEVNSYERDIEELDSKTLGDYSILQKCIRQYEIFFEIYLSHKVLQIDCSNTLINSEKCKVKVKVEREESAVVMDHIFKSENVCEHENLERQQQIELIFSVLRLDAEPRVRILQKLLHLSIAGESGNSMCDVSSDSDEAPKEDFQPMVRMFIERLMKFKLTDSARASIKQAAILLVEMSTFPNCNKNITVDKSENCIPCWLKVLCVVACFAHNDKELQITLITALFDLISLLKSQAEHATNPGVTFVVMLPLLKQGHVGHLEHKTRVFHLTISILWDLLGDPSIDPAQITGLLYQFHSCVDSGLVETVIGDRMYSQHLKNYFMSNSIMQRKRNTSALQSYTNDHIMNAHIICSKSLRPTQSLPLEVLCESESQSYKKFELLWHLGRHKQPAKSLEKLLLKVLDTLSLPYYMAERTIVTKWLQAALLRGDLARLLKPLYKILLSSHSKRVGIVHLQSLYNESKETENSVSAGRGINKRGKNIFERDVYAVSSEHGNIKYHVETKAGKKRSPIRTLKFFGVALTSKNKAPNFGGDTSPQLTNTCEEIGVIVNPLDNSPDFDDEQDEYDKVSKEKSDEEKGDEQSTLYGQDYTDESQSSELETDSEQCEFNERSQTNSLGGDIKRFAGDCERVTEVLSQHERTKNRKTYRLAHEGTPVNAEEKPDLINDSVHIADEYFCGNGNRATESPNDHVPDGDSFQASKIRRRPGIAIKEKRKKPMMISDKKRMSCISKTSTDSSNSQAEGHALMTSHSNVSDDGADRGETAAQSMSPSDTASASTINVEHMRRNLSMETSKTAASDWEIAQQALERSKDNLEILRQNAAAATTQNQDETSLRSSTKSNSSQYDVMKLQAGDSIQLFHNHLLIYLGIYDTTQVLYAFQTLRNIIACDMRTFLCLSITTSFSSSSLKQLLVRHRKSISGKGFEGSVSNSEYAQSYRGCTHLELLITLCLFYARGYFYRDTVDAKNEPPTPEDIAGNCRVQLESVELLTLICKELIDIVKGMGKGLACYIADLMARCKLQKVILHCLNSSVCAFEHRTHAHDESFASQVLRNNNPQDDGLHAEAVQVQTLRLLMATIKLEYEVYCLKHDTTTAAPTKDDTAGNISPTRLTGAEASSATKYLPNCLISQQPMLLSAVLSALQNDHLRHLHRNWTDLVTSSLNCFSFGSLTNIVISVVHQLCNNIDRISQLSLGEQHGLPPDYLIGQLEAITILCHYCLLDNTEQTSLSHLLNQAYPQTNSTATHSTHSGQLLNNIVHSFLSNTAQQEAQPAGARNPQLRAARNAVLSHLPRIVSSVASIWDSELVQLRQIKQQLMEFLSPISLRHGSNFLTAVAVTWQERGEAHRRREEKNTNLSIAAQYQRNSVLQACPEQLKLVTLVSNIRVMPMDSFVQTIHQVVKSPPPIHRPPAYLSVEVSALELFFFYMKSAPAHQLSDSWSSLLLLLRDGINLSPPAQFALLTILNEFVQRSANTIPPQMPLQDKKDARDLHDVTSRLIDSLSNVAGACLEQTTWLRRNLAVKEDIPTGNTGKDIGTSGVQQYSLQAQSVLAVTLANLLDVAYGSQEKDKVVTVVTTLLYNITPYLKNHTIRNVPSFYACSALLASITGYQYTRKAWRKDMFDLLLDGAFFQMDISCLPFWKQIVDSLITYDTTFRELMTRVSLTQSGSLNIFTSREQEYEQRSMLLKRLAFVIFCSQFDQYNKYMPDIQEQLTNSLRLLSMVPSVQAAVFLCFRVLLLRMSPDHVTSLWPIIIAEMVQVFLAMEQELLTECDDSSQKNRQNSGMDASWSSVYSNGPFSPTQVMHWRSVQLEAAKIVELGCVLPATKLPHFQMYRWAFVNTEFDVYEEAPVVNGKGSASLATLPSNVYVPHVRRIARLMDLKYTNHSPSPNVRRSHHLMLTFQQIQSLQELYAFFSTLNINCPNPRNYADTESEVAACLKEVEHVLAGDFLEKMPNSTTPR